VNPQLFKRGQVWWIRHTRDGVDHRVTTKHTDRALAEKYLVAYMDDIGRYIPDGWRQDVNADRQDAAGWLRRCHRRMKERAAKKGASCMSQSDLYRLLLSSAGRCALTEIPLVLQSDAPRNPYLASVDRIDCSAGYETNNTRIVALVVNTSLNTWGLPAVMRMSQAMVSADLRRIFSATCTKTQEVQFAERAVTP
jgi:hypothetical protein